MSQYTATFRTSYSNASVFSGEVTGDVLITPGTKDQRILIGTSNAAKPMLQVESNQALVHGVLGATTVNTNSVTSSGVFLTLGDGVAPIVGQAPLLDILSGATMLDTTSNNTINNTTDFNQTVSINNTSGDPVALTVNGDIQSTSDLRLKTELQPIPDALSKVLALQGYTYRMTNQPADGPRHMGLIAQEVQAVAPELVGEDKDGRLSLAYPNLTALLVGAIKELHALVVSPPADQ